MKLRLFVLKPSSSYIKYFVDKSNDDSSKQQTQKLKDEDESTKIVNNKSSSTTINIIDDIDQIKNLKYLSIKHNALESLPNSTSNLSQLISLDLSQNKLKALPSNFDDLINLRMVWLSFNQITSLPMKKLVNLVTFDISSNKLLSLPKDFTYLVPSRINSDIDSDECDENINTCNNINNNNSNNNNNKNSCIKNNILEMINSTELEGGLRYKQVESLMTLITSIPSEIIPGIFLGGLDSANNAPILQTLGITHILLAIGDCEPFFPKTFKYYSIDDARDAPQYDISQHFEQTNCFIEAVRKSGNTL
ncbi:hypothetical protein ACTA71_008349 [Dictyostelium dimigraforme]